MEQKDLKLERFKKLFKWLMIFVGVFYLTIIITLSTIVTTKITTGLYPKWVYNEFIQMLLLETEAQASVIQEPKIIYKNPYELTKDMTILSLYIRSRVRNTPIEVADRIAYEVCKQSISKSIPYEITVAIIEVESTWNPRAKSKKNARGLMQALIEDGISIDKEKLYGIEYNIDIGLQILISKFKRCEGSLTKVLYCYVGGDEEYTEKVYSAMGKFLLFKILYMEEL